MTRRLLLVVKHLCGPLLLRLMLAGSAGLVLPATMTIDLGRMGWRGIARRRVLSAASARCPAGDVVTLRAGWECSCRLAFEGHAFQACPHCGEVAYAVACACGRPVVNPLFRERG